LITAINDNRIGVRTINSKGQYRVTQLPSRFANGGYWNQKANAAPTTVYFGHEKRFFYVLSPGTARLETSLDQEIRAIADAAIAPILAELQEAEEAEEVAEEVTAEEVTAEEVSEPVEQTQAKTGKSRKRSSKSKALEQATETVTSEEIQETIPEDTVDAPEDNTETAFVEESFQQEGIVVKPANTESASFEEPNDANKE